MLKPALFLTLVALWAPSFQNGCQDATKAVTHLSYYPIRDMRQTVVIDPQRTVFRGPDSLSVPTTGRDRWNETMEGAPWDKAKVAMTDPYPVTEESITRGDTLYHRVCCVARPCTTLRCTPHWPPPPPPLGACGGGLHCCACCHS